MAQTQCKQCYTPVDPGQRFCPNCGAVIATDTVLPTVAATPPSTPGGIAGSSVPPTQYAGDPSATPSPGVGSTPGSSFPPTQYAGGASAAPPPPPPLYNTPASSPNSGYGAPADPYSLPSSGASPYGPPPSGPQPGSYGTPNPYAFSSSQKKSSPTMIIIGVVVVFVLLLGGGLWAIGKVFPTSKSSDNTSSGSTGNSNGTGSNGSGGNFAKEVKFNNLSIVYSSVQMTFTSIQQADQFSDDSLTESFSKYSAKKNYVRINFKEEQLSEKSSYFSYRTAFRLILPDKSVVTPLKAQEYSGPEQGVKRTNWVDFETRSQVDLSQLTLRLGASDEAQMEFPLKDGADVSKYQPKTTTLNKKFQYALMDWTLKSATQSYYFQGKQAKNGKVYITVELQADNNSDSKLYLYSDFVRLQSGSTVARTEYGSNLDDFSIIDAGTTNHQGSATFLVPTSSSYTLQFLSGKGFSSQTVPFSMDS